METFEKAYKEKLKSELKKYITDKSKSIIISNDITYKPLEKDSDSLVFVIKTGAGSKQNIVGNDLTNVVFNISIITRANNVQSILGSINSLIWNINAVWGKITIPIYDDNSEEEIPREFNYLPIFTTPFMLGDTYDLQTKSETIKAATLIMSVDVSYSSNSNSIPTSYSLKVNGLSLGLGATRVDVSTTPVYDSVIHDGKIFQTKNLLYYDTVFTFTIFKDNKNQLHDTLLLLNKGIGLEGFHNIKLAWKQQEIDYEIDISSWQISTTEENGVTVITLTLNR